jgi:hypothetical protein
MLKHRFVEFMPEVLEEGILYVSIEYCTVLHKCACGCGNTVVTPITPTDWQLKFDGRTISLSPSIGNWSFDCQSHYWIENNLIRWAGKWHKNHIVNGRMQDTLNKQQYFNEIPFALPLADEQKPADAAKKIWTLQSIWRWLTCPKS